MTYTVKEIFLTVQGEGARTGRVAVFCRFAGCNLWSGREQDRATAQCTFCDTDFVGGEKYGSVANLADAIERAWGPQTANRYVVLTGGEPLLQVDDSLILALQARDFEIAVETNGTVKAPSARLDWICVSPKTATLKQTSGDELKLVYPQPHLSPDMFEHLHFRRFSLSPLDDVRQSENTRAALEYCLAHPLWELSLQTHKILGVR